MIGLLYQNVPLPRKLALPISFGVLGGYAVARFQGIHLGCFIHEPGAC